MLGLYMLLAYLCPVFAIVIIPAIVTILILLFRRPDHPQAKREARGFPIEPFDWPPDP